MSLVTCRVYKDGVRQPFGEASCHSTTETAHSCILFITAVHSHFSATPTTRWRRRQWQWQRSFEYGQSQDQRVQSQRTVVVAVDRFTVEEKVCATPHLSGNEWSVNASCMIIVDVEDCIEITNRILNLEYIDI